MFPKTPPNFRNEFYQSKRTPFFYKDRPNCAKKLRFSRSQSTKTPSLSLKQVPVIRCPCGKGPCTISTSHSKKNPERDFYTCYQRGSLGKCGFFRWVDEVLAFKVPECTCGAGSCSLNRDEKGRWFLACRIKKGHGACGFFQWAELHTNSGMNMHFHDRIPCASPECGGFSTLHFKDDEEALCEIVEVLESSNHEVPCTSHSMECETLNRDSYSVIQTIKSSNGQVLGTLSSEEAKVPNRMLETKSLDDPNLKKICCVSNMVSQSENDRKSASCMQICAKGFIINQDDAKLSDVEGSAIGTNGVENSKVIIQQPPTPSMDAELPRGVSRCHSRCQNRNTRQNDSTSLSVFKHIGQGLLKTLEDKNLLDREKMVKIAESVFEAFHHLSICHQELEGISKCEEAECEAAQSNFQLLHGESSCAKKRKLFRNLDYELEQSEIKTLERKIRLLKINPEMSARKTSKEAAWEEMAEAFANETGRKFLKDGARTALEMARAELPS